MTRRRRVPLVLRVCTGVLLLLFTTIAANTTEDPPTSSEKLSTETIDDATISARNETIPNKIGSRNSESIGNEAVDPSNNTSSGKETVRDEVGKDAEAEREEKVAIPTIHEDAKLLQGSGSAADSSAGPGSKLEESIYGTSAGKSSSTKTLSEDFYRLSRTNGLTTVTAKPALEEGRMEGTRDGERGVQVERSNVTTSWQESSGIPGSSVVYRLGTDFPEGKGDRAKAEAKKERSEDSSPQKVRFLEKKEEEKRGGEEEEERREREESAEKKASKNSEVAGLKGEEEEEEGGPISLINDTYVNYSRSYKTSTGEATASRDGSENGTNFITEGSTVVTHHPKEEVEVVGNVTQPAIQRIVEPRSRNATSKDAGLGNVESSEIGSSRNEGYTRQDPAKANETSSIEVRETSENKVQLTTTTITTTTATSTERTFREESSTIVTSSPVPRGRTIAFSGTNEFARSSEVRSTAASRLDVSHARRNGSEDKGAKPYPYAKSTAAKESGADSSNRLAEIATEEGSAMENTIGKGRSEEKLIVTEASDVLENSIQQRSKPTYRDEGSGNESSTASSASHVARSSSTPTTSTGASVPRGGPELGIDDRMIHRGQEEEEEEEESSTSAGNDVPRWNDETPVSGVDVTGNGITEVSPRPEQSRPRDDERAYELPFREATEPSFRPSSATDLPSIETVDSSVEPLATERSERASSSPAPPVAATIEQTFVANATEASPPPTSDTNGTNEIPSSLADPEQSFAPTTTGVEYEFVSLSFDSTEYPPRPRNATTDEAPTGEDAADRASSAVPDPLSPRRNDSNEPLATTLTPPPDESDEPSSSIGETTDRSTIATTILPPNSVTRSSLLEEGGVGWSGADEAVARTTDGFAVDSWSTGVGEEEGVATERTIPLDSKDTGNATDRPVRFTPMSSVNATDGTAATPPATPSEHSIPSTASTPPGSRGVPPRDDALSPRQEITWLVRIVIEGGRYDVCPKMDKLKAILAEILQSGINKSVSDEQIILHENPCQESSDSTPSSSSADMTSILVYVVDKKGKFDTNMTKILPSLYEESRDRITFPIKETIPDSGNAVAAIVVSSVALICLVLLAGLLFVMRKRQTRFNYGERCRPVSLDAYSLDSVSAYNSVRRKGVARSSKRSYGNPTFEDSSAIPSHPLNFAGLSSFCNDINAINEEFAGIPQVSAKIDELPAGAEVKNRYANVIPLPETRVLLQKVNNDPLTEYINASYVRGPKNATKYYIACQAPMESTVTDFWRMIWEQQSKVIIMLTDLVENGVEKCTEYIPPSEITDCRRLYGDFQVTLKKRETKEKYAISTLHLNNLEKNTFREVYHIWYLWPVNGVQSDGAGLIAVLLEARALQRGGPGPIVVHCSPGTGRTGTLIALDLGIRQYEITRTVDVPRVVYTIRRDRAGAVKTKEQYAFIYKALNLYATKLAGGVLEST
ncbi:receptor-type tyrosine-protein phosphatase N2 isoform X2 [Apis laboriosa]|uniref:receptor-type tyrosine-protein phosphatase N2 isoform X2 n=1 Tax=Apis laboriosa TaxID=183418 RepID=UPI001CC7078A|nr:receptor-type tyrosine-protein phosphatase N2 isoform X2 [Apis laboriosa]